MLPYFDLVRDIAGEQRGFASQPFARSHRRIVAREDPIGSGELQERADDCVAIVLEPSAEQLHDEPAIVAIAHERWQGVTFAVDEPVGGGDIAQWIATTDGACDVCVPPAVVDSGVRVSVQKSERDLRLRTPERGAEWSASVVEDGDCAGKRVGRIDDVAAEDPWMTIEPALGAARGDDGGARLS